MRVSRGVRPIAGSAAEPARFQRLQPWALQRHADALLVVQVEAPSLPMLIISPHEGHGRRSAAGAGRPGAGPLTWSQRDMMLSRSTGLISVPMEMTALSLSSSSTSSSRGTPEKSVSAAFSRVPISFTCAPEQAPLHQALAHSSSHRSATPLQHIRPRIVPPLHVACMQ